MGNSTSASLAPVAPPNAGDPAASAGEAVSEAKAGEAASEVPMIMEPSPRAQPPISQYDNGAGVHPQQPPTKKRALVASTDLSDRHVYLCARDALMAVHHRLDGYAWRIPKRHICACRPPAPRSPLPDQCPARRPPSQATNDRSPDRAARGPPTASKRFNGPYGHGRRRRTVRAQPAHAVRLLRAPARAAYGAAAPDGSPAPRGGVALHALRRAARV